MGPTVCKPKRLTGIVCLRCASLGFVPRKRDTKGGRRSVKIRGKTSKKQRESREERRRSNKHANEKIQNKIRWGK